MKRNLNEYMDAKRSALIDPSWEDVDCLLAALEKTEHLLTDHGPQGRNYTNEQYVTLQQQLVSQTNKLSEAEQTIARLIRFPRQVNNVGGWTIDYKFIESLEEELFATTEYASSMEQIQEVLLLVEKRAALGEGAKES